MPLTPSMLARLEEQARNRKSRVYRRPAEQPEPKKSIVKYGHDIFEGTDYPATFDEFIGQREAKHQLITAIRSARNRGVPLDHVLLASGAQGIGKTTLAQIIAYELGTGFVAVSGPLTVKDARQLLRQMSEGDVLFWDEFHLAVAGNRNRADWLLPLLTDSVLMTNDSVEEMPHVTIIGATTDVGKLPATVTSRFMIRPTLHYYTDDEGIALVYALADRMKVPVTNEVVRVVAAAADNNPRDMRMILTAYRDLLIGGDGDIETALRWSGVTRDGLPQVCQEILLVLLDAPDHTASLETVQAALGEPGPLRHAEQRLIQRGYLVITGKGRKLTPEGVARAHSLLDGKDEG